MKLAATIVLFISVWGLISCLGGEFTRETPRNILINIVFIILSVAILIYGGLP